ncbi:hypothetical protein J6590_012420 [Homalodisca vitripennis]|nr:hypothetical protein J6590_012420 [Homalodisca vitripennis]
MYVTGYGERSDATGNWVTADSRRVTHSLGVVRGAKTDRELLKHVPSLDCDLCGKLSYYIVRVLRSPHHVTTSSWSDGAEPASVRHVPSLDCDLCGKLSYYIVRVLRSPHHVTTSSWSDGAEPASVRHVPSLDCDLCGKLSYYIVRVLLSPHHVTTSSWSDGAEPAGVRHVPGGQNVSPNELTYFRRIDLKNVWTVLWRRGERKDVERKERRI